MEYTKETWKAGNTDVTAGTKHIANCYFESRNFKRPSFDEALANARLIAQAPKMYEALKLYVGLCGNTAYQVDREGLQEAFKQAMAVLAEVEKK